MDAFKDSWPDGLAMHAGLTVERLAKAALLKRSPSFIIDFSNKDHAWRSLLLLSGYPTTNGAGKTPRLHTVSLEVALKRLIDLGATGENLDIKDVELLSAARNAAAHGGGVTHDADAVAGSFVRITDLLLNDLAVDRTAYWAHYYTVAIHIRDGEEKRLKDSVEARINRVADAFAQLPSYALEEAARRSELASATVPTHRTFACPSCGNLGLLDGAYYKRDQSTVDPINDVPDESLFLVDDFYCPACKLGLHGQLEVRLGSVITSFTVKDEHIPRPRMEKTLREEMFSADYE
jgi:hypothetical protein